MEKVTENEMEAVDYRDFMRRLPQQLGIIRKM